MPFSFTILKTRRRLRWEDEGLLFNQYKVSVLQDEKKPILWLKTVLKGIGHSREQETQIFNNRLRWKWDSLVSSSTCSQHMKAKCMPFAQEVRWLFWKLKSLGEKKISRYFQLGFPPTKRALATRLPEKWLHQKDKGIVTESDRK